MIQENQEDPCPGDKAQPNTSRIALLAAIFNISLQWLWLPSGSHFFLHSLETSEHCRRVDPILPTVRLYPVASLAVSPSAYPSQGASQAKEKLLLLPKTTLISFYKPVLRNQN